jgi:hypothetical protein
MISDEVLNRTILKMDIPMGGIGRYNIWWDKATPFCGNQHNENWRWDAAELAKLRQSDRIQIYEILAGKKYVESDFFDDFVKGMATFAQRQDSVTEQLTDLKRVATKLGMYDASDLIQQIIEGKR